MMNEKQAIEVRDIGIMPYQEAWDYQEVLLRRNLAEKTGDSPQTTNYLLFTEHPPVYTLGKSGKSEHVLMSEEQLAAAGIEFVHTNRGGDITFHGPGQMVVYPIFDLEKFSTDIGWYLRSLEEVVIRTLKHYNIVAGRSKGETGVWIEPEIKGRERKICAMGVRCSRWVTMHGLALNIKTDLSYFNNIIPCGIPDKKVTSIEQETGKKVLHEEVKRLMIQEFAAVFDAHMVLANAIPLEK
jgi:lipoyl(octanoyl) transferase